MCSGLSCEGDGGALGVMKSLFIPQNLLAKFWNETLNPVVADIYFPRKLTEGFSWGKMESDFSGEIFLNEVRMPQPLKSLFFLAREKVWGHPPPVAREAAKPKKIIIGAKSCDLRSLPILDFVFREGDFEDPLYIDNRKNSLIISSDCDTFLETCFCPLLDINPFAFEGFDLNLSKASEGFIIDIGSTKGEAFVELRGEYFRKASDEELQQREANRKKVLKELRGSLEAKGFLFKKSFKELVGENYNSDLWEEIALTCVECGGCNFVCPTCHCFLLSDAKREEFIRLRNWDACQYPAFGRVAGGANPRKRRTQRFRNRFDKKFVFFQDVLGMDACTGCGRCIDACLGKIDIREVFKKLKQLISAEVRSSGESTK